MKFAWRVVLYWCEDRLRRGATGEESSRGMMVFIVFQEGMCLYDVTKHGVFDAVADEVYQDVLSFLSMMGRKCIF